MSLIVPPLEKHFSLIIPVHFLNVKHKTLKRVSVRFTNVLLSWNPLWDICTWTNKEVLFAKFYSVPQRN